MYSTYVKIQFHLSEMPFHLSRIEFYFSQIVFYLRKIKANIVQFHFSKIWILL